MNQQEDGIKTLKSSLFSILANVISVFVSLIIVSILSNKMTTSDMGMATSFITMQTVFSYIVFVAINTSINKAIMEKNINFDEYLSTISIFSIISVIFWLLITTIFYKKFSLIFGFNYILFLFMYISILFNNVCSFLYTKWNYKNEYIKCFIYNILLSPISQILSLFFVIILNKNKYIGRILGLQILQIILGFICLFYILYKGKFKFKKNYFKYAFAISFPTMWHLLSQIILSNSDLLMIKYYLGSSDAGLYSIAYTISNVFLMAVISAIKPWSPWVYRRLELDEIDSVNKNSKLILIMCFILCFGLITIAPEMIHIFINKSYYDSISIIYPLCIAMYFQILYILFYDVEYYYKANKRIAIFSCIAALINFILNIFLIKKIGYQVAAYTTLFSYLILAIFHFIGMKQLDKRDIINFNYTLVISILLPILSLISFNFLNSIIIRYIIFILIFCFILIIFRKQIFEFSKCFRKDEK